MSNRFAKAQENAYRFGSFKLLNFYLKMKERVWTFIEALTRFQLTLKGFRSTEYQQKNLMILGATWNVSLVGTCIF